LKRKNERKDYIIEMESRLKMITEAYAVSESNLQIANGSIAELTSSSNAEIDKLKRSEFDARLELLEAREELVTLKKSFNERPVDLPMSVVSGFSNSALKKENDMLSRRVWILTNLYSKSSSFEGGGLGLFCNIDITVADIGMYLIDFLGFERAMTKVESEGRISNKYLLHIRAGYVFDCKAKALANICLASRCNQTARLGPMYQPHLGIVYKPGGVHHFVILRAAFANCELLTTYNNRNV